MGGMHHPSGAVTLSSRPSHRALYPAPTRRARPRLPPRPIDRVRPRLTSPASRLHPLPGATSALTLPPSTHAANLLRTPRADPKRARLRTPFPSAPVLYDGPTLTRSSTRPRALGELCYTNRTGGPTGALSTKLTPSGAGSPLAPRTPRSPRCSRRLAARPPGRRGPPPSPCPARRRAHGSSTRPPAPTPASMRRKTAASAGRVSPRHAPGRLRVCRSRGITTRAKANHVEPWVTSGATAEHGRATHVEIYHRALLRPPRPVLPEHPFTQTLCSFAHSERRLDCNSTPPLAAAAEAAPRQLPILPRSSSSHVITLR